MNFIQFTEKFNNDQACLDYFASIRWWEGVFCPFCHSPKVYNIRDPKRPFKCGSKGCKRNFSHISTTLFDNTKIPIRLWFFVLYMVSASRKSISSIHVAQTIGVTQKTAWAMMLKIKKLFFQDAFLRLSGAVEIDECYMSKNHEWRKFGQINTRKLPVIGMKQRGGKLITVVVGNRRISTINKLVERHIEPFSTIYTDSSLSYNDLPSWYEHHKVNHSKKEYVRGSAHTNSIENVWKQLKSALKYSHCNVSQKYLQLYCDEVTYRMNTSEMSVMERFNNTLWRAVREKNTVSDITSTKLKDNSLVK